MELNILKIWWSIKTVNIAEPVVVSSSLDIPYIKESIKRNRNIVPNNMTALLKYLFLKWDDLKVIGRIYIAKEGINAQLSCPKPNWDKFVESVLI